MVTLTVGYDPDIDRWYFVVREDEAVLHFRHGFASRADAAEAGSDWIRQTLGLSRLNE
jgi:hypothetical protein